MIEITETNKLRIIRKLSRPLALALASGLLSTASMGVKAQVEDQEIRLVVPFAAGGSATTSARIFADHLSKALGQKIYIDNKGGASGAIGASFVARAPADGRTLLYSSAAMMTINPSLFGETLGYKEDQFVPVSLANTFASVMFVSKDFPARDLKELIANAKANPNTITFGSAGAGSSGHLLGEFLKDRAKIDIQHVPYKGTAPALIDVIGGRISFVLDAAAAGYGQLQSGNLRALAVTSENRMLSLPDTPTFSEQGVTGLDPLNWYGLFAPAGTPDPILKKIAAATAEVAQSDEYRKQLDVFGMSAASSSSSDLKERVKKESLFWGEIIKNAKITVQ